MSGMMPFGLKIAIINRAFRKKMDEKASSMGLTSVQLRVLGSISRLEAAGQTEIHQIDLERIEHVTHPAMTKLLQRLESKGFVRCVPSSKDRRYKKNHLHRPIGRYSRGHSRARRRGSVRAVCKFHRGTKRDADTDHRHDFEQYRPGILVKLPDYRYF